MKPMEPRPSVALTSAMRAFLYASFALTSASLLFSMLARVFKLPFPYTYPYYYSPGNLTSDFTAFRPKFASYGTSAFFTTQNGYFMYPAPLAHIIRFFFRLSHPMVFFFVVLLLIGAILTVAFALVLRRRGLSWNQTILFTAGTLITSYPYLFLLQRWNVEVFVWLPSMFGIWFFCTGRYRAAALCFGVATSLKLYPFMFFGLFLPRRKYGAMALGAATAILITVVSLWWIGPTLSAAFAWNSAQLQAFSKQFSGGVVALGYDHSFFGLLKFSMLHWRMDFATFSRPYTAVAACISVVLYFTRIRHMPLANQIIVLSILSVCLPPVSFDYTLVSLYGAVLMLCVMSLQAQKKGTRVPALTMYLVLFALVLTPESYIVWSEARYGAQLRCFVMIVILVMALRKPLPEFLVDEALPA